jgi:hypothetical protein
MSELPVGALDGEIELIITGAAGDVVTIKPAEPDKRGGPPSIRSLVCTNICAATGAFNKSPGTTAVS